MAGHRRGTGRPTRAQARASRRRALMVTRLGRAGGPAERLAVAYGYVRAALADLDPRTADQLAGELVQALVAAADTATTRTQRRRVRR